MSRGRHLDVCTPDLAVGTDQIRDACGGGLLDETWVQAAKQACIEYVEAYETAVLGMIDSYEQAATATKVDWIVQTAAEQAKASRKFATTQTAVARQALVA